MWIRTCQECGHKQEDFNPNTRKMSETDIVRFGDRQCKECRSRGLDWGKEQISQDDSTWS